MSYVSLILFIILTIITIIIAILLTIAIDNLARLPDPSDVIQSNILDNVTGLGGFIIIFLIFLIAVGLIGAILAFYYGRVMTESSLLFYTGIVFTFLTLAVLALEFYTYRELLLYRPLEGDRKIIDQSVNYFLWGIGLTVFLLFLSFVTLFFI